METSCPVFFFVLGFFTKQLRVFKLLCHANTNTNDNVFPWLEVDWKFKRIRVKCHTHGYANIILKMNGAAKTMSSQTLTPISWTSASVFSDIAAR